MTTASQATTTGLDLTVPIDSDITTHQPPPELDAVSAAADTAADSDELSGVVAPEAGEQADDTDTAEPVSRFTWRRVLAYALLPTLALSLALSAAYLKWQDGSARLAQTAAVQSRQAATETTAAMLSYRPETVDKQLPGVADRLTGKFRDQYVELINDVVIPGARQKKIAAVATVPAAASVSATGNHAEVLVFVNQTVTIGDDAPTDTASSVRVTLDKVDGRWLVAQFEPI